MKSELTIGKVLKSRGLKGELKIELYASDSARFSHLKRLKIDGIEYGIDRISPEGAIGYVSLEGIDTVEKAEALRGKLITANRNDLPKLPDGKYYIVDIGPGAGEHGGEVIACGTAEEIMKNPDSITGAYLSEVCDVLQYGSADVYVVKNGANSFSFPAISGLVKQVDLDLGKIVLDDMIFPRVVVYN